MPNCICYTEILNFLNVNSIKTYVNYVIYAIKPDFRSIHENVYLKICEKSKFAEVSGNRALYANSSENEHGNHKIPQNHYQMTA